MLIAQITDLHIGGSSTYRLDTRQALRNAVSQINALRPSPDLCLVTGDIAESGSAADYAIARAELSELAIPWHPIPGNHDDRPTFIEAFADRMPSRMPDFAQYIVDTFPLRIIALDSVIPRRSEGELCATRLAWLAGTLEAAPDRPAMLMLHHPPFATRMPSADTLCLSRQSEFADIISRHPQVEAIVCGHIHRAIHGRVAHVPASIAPSTAHQVSLALRAEDPLAFTHEPPGFQLHMWNGPGTWTTHTIQIGQFGGPFPFH